LFLPILVTDRHASYINMNVAGHQICLAHILIELTCLTELYFNQSCSSQLTELIREAIHKSKTDICEHIDRYSILDRFIKLLTTCIASLHIKIIAIKKSLIKHNDNVFNFLFITNVLYDNNASERAVRTVKVKTKSKWIF